MSILSYTAEAYASLQKRLLPRGRLWRLTPDSLLHAVFLAAGDELQRISGRLEDLIVEADPRFSTELIERFENEMGLPSTGTLEERQARAAAHDKKRPRARVVDIQAAMAPYLDLDAEDIEVIPTTRAQAVAMNNDRAFYRLYVYRDPTLPGTYDVEAAQAELDRVTLYHDKPKVIESKAFKVGDPYSLVGRDLLGE